MSGGFDFLHLAGDSDSVAPSEFDVMAKKEEQPYVLVPEIALLRPLPEHLRKRFIHALHLMHDEQAEHRTWEQIATESAISPYHFHRQFTELFNETPGQYLSRLRLQVSVSLLMNDDPWSVTEIAQYCGFSSSQALGKALKRELGVTAKQIRKMGYESTPRESAAFIRKLAHPGKGLPLESELAQSIPTKLIRYPQRGMKKVPNADPDWDSLIDFYGEKSVRLMGATPVHQLEKSWDHIDTYIGDWQVEEEAYDFIIPEGYYLCSEVYLVSDAGYSAALESLFDVAMQRSLSINEDGFLVEVLRHIELSSTGGMTFSFQIPIIK